MRGTRAVCYCSSWDDDPSPMTMGEQKEIMFHYALKRGFTVQDTIVDEDRGRRVFDGLELMESLVSLQQVDHIIISSIDRVCDHSSQVFGFLGRFIDSKVILHIVDWNISSKDPAYRFLVRSLNSIQSIDLGPSALETGRVRAMKLWHDVFNRLTDEKYAGSLIESLFKIGNIVFHTSEERRAVESGYDHMQMFNALGYRIKGESTNNTMLVADVIVRNWVKIKRVVGQDVLI